MKLLLAHPTGNQFFRHLAAGLAESGQLGRVASCVNFAGFLDTCGAVLPAGVRSELERRTFREPWAADLRTHPARELGRLLAQRLGWTGVRRHERGWFSVDAVYQEFDGWLARRLPRWQREAGLGGVYAYEDGALATFTAAQELGLFRAYDLPIAFWETSGRLLREEVQRWPEWEPTLGATSDSPEKLARKTRELELADLVVCPSVFVADSLPELVRREKQVIVAPFGSPEDSNPGLFNRGLHGLRGLGSEPKTQNPKLETTNEELGAGDWAPETKNEAPRTKNYAQRPLRVLFAGSMSQRKGLADVFAACKLLGSRAVELVVMGTPIRPLAFYRQQFPGFIHEPPRPHRAVLELMRTCDVLVLPSIVEGRALVMQEAMSQGLPIIVTPNTGGEDLVEPGRTGFLVPIRRPDALAERIAWCTGHPEEVRQMGQAARIKARAYSWQRYSDTICAALSRTQPG